MNHYKYYNKTFSKQTYVFLKQFDFRQPISRCLTHVANYRKHKNSFNSIRFTDVRATIWCGCN